MSAALANSFQEALEMLGQLSIVCTLRNSLLISHEMRDQKN